MPIDRGILQGLVDEGLSVREIARHQQCSPRTVQIWLRRHGLRTQRGGERRKRSRRASEAGQREVVHDCPRHGSSAYVRRKDGGYRCRRCASEAVSRRRRGVKEILVREAGGQCALCGYDRCLAALQFHHLDPERKAFSLAATGVTRSLALARAEAAKCALLCANCHAEVEAGVAAVP